MTANSILIGFNRLISDAMRLGWPAPASHHLIKPANFLSPWPRGIIALNRQSAPPSRSYNKRRRQSARRDCKPAIEPNLAM